MAYQHINNAWGLVADGFTRVAGDPTITLRAGDGARFGDPTPESPLRLLVHRKNSAPTGDFDRYQLVLILEGTGRTDDDLTVAGPIEGFADAEVLPGDVVTCGITAGDLADLWAALAAIELTPGPPGVGSFGLSMPPGFTVANSPLTESGTIAVSTTLAGILKGDGAGFGVAIPGTDYATPAAVAAKADDSAVVHRDGAEAITGAKTFTGGATVRGGLSVRDSVGAEVSGFDADGYGFPAPIAFTLARGVDLTAGTDLTDGGALVPFAGKLAKVLVKAKINGASGGFSLQLRRNGTAIFAAPVAVAAGDTSTKVFASFAVDSVSPGDEITPDASAVGAGVQGVRVLLVPLGGNR